MLDTLEQLARQEIDTKLVEAGWIVQNIKNLNLSAGRGIVVREFPMKTGFGFADYLLYLHKNAIGAVEAKASDLLAGVETQSAKYAVGLPDKLPAHLGQLKEALERPPLAIPPEQLWRTFQIAKSVRVADSDPYAKPSGESLADLVSLVRHTIEPEVPLEPYALEAHANYREWLHQQEEAGNRFSDEQQEWLDRMAEHIGTSLEITHDDFVDGWFGQNGSLGKVSALFGDRLESLLATLNERLVT